MSVLVLGLNYKNTPVDLLGRLAVPTEHLPKALASLVRRDHVDEAVVLSTCNRVEIYAHVTRYHGGMADLRSFFWEFCDVPVEDFAHLAYDYYDDRAAAHLFAVAAGLDSMVVGERQIHLQVKEAFKAAQEQGAAGRLLQSLFRRALRVGKRARSETAISAGASSMVDVGIDAAEQVLGQLAGRTVLVVGAGKMGGMAAGRLDRVAGRILVANRTPERAQRLADKVSGEVLAFSDLHEGLVAADLVLCSTGAPEPVVDHDTVAAAMQERGDRPLALVDLAVPRDVDPGCSAIAGVNVLDIDTIRAVTHGGSTGEEAAQARRIVEEEAAAFAAWTRTVHVEPTIAALRDRMAELAAQEVQRSLGRGRLSNLDDRQRAAVQALAESLVNRVLHEPSVRLKGIADARGGELHASVLRELFDLPE